MKDMIACYTEAGPPACWGVLHCPLPSLPAGGSYAGVRLSSVSEKFGLVEEPGHKERLFLQVPSLHAAEEQSAEACKDWRSCPRASQIPGAQEREVYPAEVWYLWQAPPGSPARHGSPATPPLPSVQTSSLLSSLEALTSLVLSPGALGHGTNLGTSPLEYINAHL